MSSSDSLKQQFLKYLLGEREEIKIGEFWLRRTQQPEGMSVEIETDLIRESRNKKEKVKPFNGPEHKKIRISEKHRLIKSPPPPITDEELSLIS